MEQLQAINYILDNNDSSFITGNNLNEDYFPQYRKEYDFIAEHIKEFGKVPDKISFFQKFPDCDSIVVTESPDYLLKKLNSQRQVRLVIDAFNQARTIIGSDDIDAGQQLINVLSNTVAQASSASTIKSLDITKDVSRYNDYIDKINSGYQKYYVTTGFAELDNILGGWDRREELATIVARTNQGKSWILLKCATAAAEVGLNVGLYSGEMSANKVGYRFDTLYGHISNSGIIRGYDAIQNKYKSYIDNLSRNGLKGSLKVLTPSMVGGSVGVNALGAFIEREHLDMLCVDQHSLLDDDRKAKNPVERAANISRDLKQLQVMKQIPIITVSQQNRTSTENGVDTTHIAQSDRIGQDSTVILFFEQKDGIITINLVKSRDSENGKKLEYAIDFDKGIFRYMPSEHDGNPNAKEEIKLNYAEFESEFGEDIDEF